MERSTSKPLSGLIRRTFHHLRCSERDTNDVEHKYHLHALTQWDSPG